MCGFLWSKSLRQNTLVSLAEVVFVNDFVFFVWFGLGEPNDFSSNSFRDGMSFFVGLIPAERVTLSCSRTKTKGCANIDDRTPVIH